MAARFRTFRLRSVDGNADQLLLPPPLPLIQLPTEARLARTGVPGERPTHLPVRRHLECQAASRGERPLPEPILVESRLLLDAELSEYEELEVANRICVYEYNRPEVFQYSGAPDDTLVFDSLFESGNLQRADRVFRARASAGKCQHQASQEYELVVHPDVMNGAYRQWFYFEVRNGRPGVTYRFSLVNLAKSANNALSFNYRFEHENDCVYFACIQPYTYTDLMEYLDRLEKDLERAQTFRRTELCQTIAQNACDMLTITSPGKQGLAQEDRQIIVLSARVHPGEPNSSWMMKGMIDYLTGSSAGATVLRRKFVFKVVPMLNPDGVINGNTRVNLAGWDLNRKWASPVEKLFPTVFHLKRQLASYQSRGRVAIYCDLHGHSISRNIFMYGCYSHKASSTALLPTSEDVRAQIKRIKGDSRVLPMIVARHSAFFCFANCDFKVQKSKLTTARVVVHHELGVANSYTLEASFCGPDFGPRKHTQFSTWDLEDMGRSWCQSLLVYFDLVAEVKELEAERDRELMARSIQQQQQQQRQEQQRQASDVASLGREEEEGEQLLSILLDDYEAAISELFAQSQLDEDGDSDEGVDGDHRGGSDLSDAEEEPIPPSMENNDADTGKNGIAHHGESNEGERKRSRKKKARRKKKKRSHSKAAKQYSRKSSDSRPHQRTSEDSKGKVKKKTGKSKRKAAEADPEDKGAESDTAVRGSRRKNPAATRANRSKSLRSIPRAEEARVFPLTIGHPGNATSDEDVRKGETPSAKPATLADDVSFVLPSVTDPATAPRRLWTAPAKYRGVVVDGAKESFGQASSRGRLELPALGAARDAAKFARGGEDEEGEEDGGEFASDGEASDGDGSDTSVQSEPPGAYSLDF